MSIQGVGGFLIAVLVISLIAGGLAVTTVDQHGIIQEQETQLAELQRQMGLANEQLAAYQKIIEDYKKENQRLQTQITAYQATIAGAQQENKQLQERVALLTQQLAARQAALEAAERALAENAAQEESAPHLQNLVIGDPAILGAMFLVTVLVNLLVYLRAHLRKTDMIRVTPEERSFIIRRRRNHNK